MKVVAIIQARMGSTRLPGKVLLDLNGAPVLDRVVRRVRRATRIHETWVATTVHSVDDAIVEWCARHSVQCYRGSEDDVLDRYHGAGTAAQADVIVRVTSDCPLIDPEVLDEVVAALHGVEYACNFLPRRTYPRGLDAEAFTRSALDRAHREDGDPAWREHVTTYLQRNPAIFRQQGVTNPVDCSAFRWTVDTPEDLQLARLIYQEFLDDAFSWKEALAVMDRHPEWMAINAHIEQKKL